MFPRDTWRPGPLHPECGKNDLHLWRINLDDVPMKKAVQVLDSGENARVARFLPDGPALRFAGSRAALRFILARYLRRPAASLVFEVGPHGKPRLCGAGPSFNLSHAGGIALIAVTACVDVGVDVEQIAAGRATVDIARRFFSPAEQKALDAVPEAERTEAFYRIWSRKEAVIKMLGEGLACPLDSFDVTANPEAATLLDFRRSGQDFHAWSLVAIRIDSGYAAAAAAAGPITKVESCQFDWNEIG